MFFGLLILLLLYLACLGLLGGAVVSPFFYGTRRLLALFLNVLGFVLFVPVMTLFGMASAAEPPEVALGVAVFFFGVEILVFALRWVWLHLVSATFLSR